MPADQPGPAAEPHPVNAPGLRGWLAAARVYLEPASLRMLALGFSAGLPLLLVLGTLSFRLREAGIDRATIGYLSWVGLAYAFKWCWAPLVDRLPIPWLTRTLGRRRSWLLLSQCLIVAGLVGMALSDPRLALGPIVWCALAVAVGSATQDIALDAFRIESADADHQGALAATYQTGYRLAMIWAGAGVLWVAARFEVAPAAVVGITGATVAAHALAGAAYQQAAWQMAYLVMAGSMAVGVLTVLLSPEPARVALPPARNAREWLQGALVEPFADFIGRYRWQAALILALIAIYRISDVVMGIMANPFYVDMGYTKDEVAAVTKIYGVIMTLVGAFIGGMLSLRLGVMRVLMLGAVLSAATNLLFAGPERARPRRDGADLRDLGRQPVQRHRLGGVHRLPVVAHQRALLGHAVRAVQLHDAARPQMAGGVFGRLRRCVRLCQLLCQHRAAGGAGAVAGVAGFKG